VEILLKGRDRASDYGDFGSMTAEEIKGSVTMREVLSKYGVSVNSNGMCCCPIHKERHPSMKVFKDGYKCFACGSNGDIFSFVQEMENCDFKQAFKLLGGTYKRYGSERTKANAQAHYNRQKILREKAAENEKRFRSALMGAIDMCRFMIDHQEPFSDEWCYAQNNLPYLWHVYENKYLEGEEVEEANVFRRCKEIRQRFIIV